LIHSPPAVLHIRHLPGNIAYEEGLRLQEELVRDILAETEEDTILLLEHQPVYTIGRLRDQSSLRETASLPYPVFETNRGGQATYHGPGQLVGYPVLDLNPRGKDLHDHLRKLENALIHSCAAFGVDAGRRDGLTGVWVENRKLASIGVGVRKWISMHGFAINITDESLPPFFAITPCGLDGVSMTSLETEAGRKITVAEAATVVEKELRSLFSVERQGTRPKIDTGLRRSP
jgi:lipoyl(octanoyl) transferase